MTKTMRATSVRFSEELWHTLAIRRAQTILARALGDDAGERSTR